MRHVETAAERVAQLMMQGDRRRTQYHACEPASVKRLRPRLVVAPIFREPGEALVKRSYALFGHHRHDRIAIDGIKAFHAMSDGIEAARQDRKSTRLNSSH